MQRFWTASLLTARLTLVLAAAYVLTTPPAATAATGSANCGYGITAYCQGGGCSCVDGQGCITFDQQGNVTKVTLCEDLIRKAGPVAQTESGPVQ